ncbi:hypothetical protein BsWGS_10032 [Bradybaena similaris]
MLDVDSSGAENTQAIDDAILHSLASDLIAGARFEGYDRNVILIMVIRAVEMMGDRNSRLIVYVTEMVTKSVCQSPASFPDISLGASFANKDWIAGFPITSRVGDSVAFSPITSRVGDSVAGSPITSRVGEWITGSPITSRVGDWVAGSPITSRVGDWVAGSPITFRVGEWITGSPITSRVGDWVAGSPITSRVGDWGTSCSYVQ